MNRRESLTLLAGTALAASIGLPGRGTALAQALSATQALSASASPCGPSAQFTLPPLGYDFSALEPFIDAPTMLIHHDRHHAAYVDNANGLANRWPEIATTPIETMLADLNKVPESVRAAVRNNVGGHWNHTFFWDVMTPGGSKVPVGDLKSAIDAVGGFVVLRDTMNAAGSARFGAGWVWLVVNKQRKLDIVTTANQDTPLELGAKAIVGIDLWEHAYYLKYQNRRADYMKSWWNVVNWDKAAANFKKAMQTTPS